jgi:hypothetical protein
MTEPARPEPDDKDWTWVLDAACPECGYDAAALARDDIPARTLDAAGRLARAVRAGGAAVRPDPQTWSALEYGAHVRDVCLVFSRRATLMLTEDDPLFDNWDQDATALEERYWSQPPALVADQLDAAAAEIAAVFASVPDDAWTRVGRRSNGSRFTVETLGAYFLHDLVHHAHDVGA